MNARRTFLTSSVLGFAALAAPRRGAFPPSWSAGPRPPEAARPGCGSEVVMGRYCRELVGAGVSARLTKRGRDVLPLLIAGSPEAARELGELCRRDFQLGRTITVDGWILAESEVGLWLAAAEHEARHGEG